MLPGGQVLLNGEDVSTAIRTPAVTAATGAAATIPSFAGGWRSYSAASRRGVIWFAKGAIKGRLFFRTRSVSFSL